MTRYTRAKGSKASNEKIPNDATPWHVMKEQLVENLCKKQEPSEKTKSVEELLEEKQNTVTNNNIEHAHSSWAEFPNNTNNTKQRNNLITNKAKKIQKTELNKIKTNPNILFDNHENNTDINKLIDKLNVKRKKDKHNTPEINKNKNDTVIEMDGLQNEKDTFSKRQKRNMKRKKSLNKSTSDSTENNINNDIMLQDINDSKSKSDGTNQTTRFDENFVTKSQNFGNIPNKFNMRKFNNQKTKRKPPKIRDDKEHKRRKPDLGSSKIMINGIEVEIVKFDGFPIKKEDADRLTDLKQKMIMKGIPQTEINAAMKLERRKAEKALARIRKCVCFHCRKAGHNLSDCPELGSEQAGTGICFKCGSTEHTHFECKVAKPTEFRYATCFICREQGHIAKQCPDNPKGVYPQGGACKICGDVTHLKKDCPDLIKEKEENTITVNTIANDNLESLEEDTNRRNIKDNKKTKNIVKF
ncbi:PREDICTED: GATA zinc finger domain-containing protein 8-like [Eufriesea mexicana]|uniref:GATA zinc finger domain-containing protein 8-like n=1 Tax=Eufriesea mexicana TaxID=516756 RepID=UPI00083C8C61|nr:PREDICTED: GATA zinc finger domain-containing protein 8-like [Eufriesea mexicana]